MKATYNIVNLGCALCASKMEEKINQLDEVDEAIVNYSTSKLYLKSEKTNADLLYEIDNIIKSVEADASLDLEGKFPDHDRLGQEESDHNKTYERIRLFLPIFLLGLSFFIAREDFKRGILILAYIIAGSDVVFAALNNISKGEIFDENFLMTIASMGAIMIGELTEAVAVMVFFSIGEYFQDRAVDKSRKSITDLMDIRAEYANLIKDGQIVQTDPNELVLGDEILIKPGEKVPVDGIVISGQSSIDTSALTGESLPREIEEGEDIVSGSVNINSTLKVKVTSLYEDSAVARILKLVEESGAKKAPAEKFITRFSKVYTPIVCFSALALALIPPILLGDPFAKWVYRALVFLVASCPCALVISVPLAFFAAIGRLSKDGLIIKGANHIEDMAGVDRIAFDKTGSLTKGNFVVDSVNPIQGISEDQILKAAATAESMSSHPIANSIRRAYGGTYPEAESIEEIGGHGIIANSQGSKIYVGNGKLMDKFNISYHESNKAGTVIYVGIDGEYLGNILIKDEIKEESKKVINTLNNRGISTIMLTGDNALVAQEVADIIGIKEYRANLLPQDKLGLVEDYKKDSEGKIAFVGDGINDAPVLIASDIGIAMGQIGSDAAIEAADIVIMEDNLQSLVNLLNISNKTMRIVVQNIVLSLGIKAIVIIAGALGYAPMWMAVFADVGLALIAIVNSMRILNIGSD